MMPQAMQPAITRRPFQERTFLQCLLAAGTYFIVAIIFTWPVVSEINKSFIGQADAYLFTWDLHWWPFALGHFHNPFITDYIYAPVGANLTWTTPVPLLAFLAWPICHFFGYAAAYNVLYIGSLVASAAAAFYLGRYISGSFGAGMLAGFIYGFSPYMLCQSLGHLNLVFTPFLPLMVLVIWAFFREDISKRRFVVFLSLLLLCQLLTYEETFALLTIVMALSFLVAYVVFWGNSKGRRRLAAACQGVFLSYCIAAAAFSPYLYYQFLGPPSLRPPSRLIPPNTFVTDLLNLAVPTRMHLIGGALFSRYTERFTGNVIEWDGYLGLPIIVLLIAALLSPRLPGKVRLFLYMILASVVLLSLGPRLHVAGRATRLMLPWSLIDSVPLIRQAMPSRLMVFAFLCTAVISSLWLARASWLKKLVCSSLIAVSFLPALPYTRLAAAAYPSSPSDVAQLRRLVPEGSTMLMLPFDLPGEDLSYSASSMLYQVAAGFWMKIPEAYTGTYTPSGFMQGAQDQRGFAILPREARHTAEFNGLLEKAGISTILLREQRRDSSAWEVFLNGVFGPCTGEIAGAKIWRLSPEALSQSQSVRLGGDYFLDQTSLDGWSWLGNRLDVSTRKCPVALTLSGEFRPPSLPPVKLTVNVNGSQAAYLLDRSSRIVVMLPGEAAASVRCETTFVPSEVLGNRDTRRLSAMFSIRERGSGQESVFGRQGLTRLQSVQFSGDCFFEMASLGAFSWMGGSMQFSTSNFPAELTLSGECRPPSLPPVKVIVNVNGTEEDCVVGKGSKITVAIPADANVAVRSGATFVPTEVVGNKDPRRLSVMFSLNERASPR